MMGLVRKDFYLAGVLAKSYLFILAVFVILSLTGVYDGTFLASFLSLMCIMLPVNVFSYDEQAKWDKYAAALPGGRAGVVRARYLFTLLVSLGSVALGGAAGVLTFLLAPQEGMTLWEMAVSIMGAASVGIVLNALLLPLMFKFGVQKGRIYLVLVMAVIFGLLFGGMTALAAMEGLESLTLPMVAAPAAGLLLLVPSYYVSLSIFRKKDL